MRLIKLATNRGFLLLATGCAFMLGDVPAIYSCVVTDWTVADGQIVRSAVVEAPHHADGKRYYWDLAYTYSVAGVTFTGGCLSPGESYSLCSRERAERRYALIPAVGEAIGQIHGDASRGLIEFAAARYSRGQEVKVFHRRESPDLAVLSIDLVWENLRKMSLGIVLAIVGILFLLWGRESRNP